MSDPIRAALERLQEYAVAHPEHDTGELVATARAALAAEPAFVASEPSDEDLADLAEVFNGDPVPAMRRALELWGRPTISSLAAEPHAPAPAIPLDLDALLSPEGAYEPGTGQEDGAQLVDLCWWAPVHGCETLENLLDRIRRRILPHLRPPIAGIDVPGTDGDYGGLQELCDAEGVDVRIGAPLLKRAREAWGAAQPAPAADGERDHVPDARNMVAADVGEESEYNWIGRDGQSISAREWLADWVENEARFEYSSDNFALAAALLRQQPIEGVLIMTEHEVLLGYGLIPVVYDAGGGARIERIIAEDGDWSVRNSRHISPVTGFPTATAAWAALQQARQQEVGR